MSIADRGFDRAVILTDGYAFLTDEKNESLQEGKVKLLTILLGGSTECASLASFGEVVKLDQVVG